MLWTVTVDKLVEQFTVTGLPVVLKFHSCPEIVLKFYSFGQNVLKLTFVMLS